MAATDFVTESQIDSLTTTIAMAVKSNTTLANTKTDDTAVTAHTGAASGAHAASAISFADVAGDYTATDVEAALAEVKVIADSAAGGGTAINDSATNTSDAWSSQKISDEISTAVNNLVDGAPAALDTLNELAAAIGDNVSYEASVTTALGNRLRFDAAQALDSGEKAQALTNLGIVASTQDFAADFTAGLA